MPTSIPRFLSKAEGYLIAFHPFWHLPKDSIEYLMRQFHRFIDCVSGWDDSDIDLLFSSQPDPGNQARAKVDHALIVQYLFPPVRLSVPLLPGRRAQLKRTPQNANL
jgi:hypothetical protein